MFKSFLYAIMLFLCFSSIAQTIVNYTEDNAAFANPERGFYHHTETHSPNYIPLNKATLESYLNNEQISLILRVFYLEDFKTTAISQAYLDAVDQDFKTVRDAGLKCIVRFAYNNNQNQTDASKAIIKSHLTQLTPILKTNADVIACMQAGFIGSWGEWYYTTQAEFGLPGNTPNYANRGDVLFAILDALPDSRMVQLRTPAFKTNIFSSSTPLNSSEAFSGTDIARSAHHNDCFLASSTDFGTYTNVSADKAYLSQECVYLVNGGETCNPSEFSNCPNALTDLSNLHFSYLNIDYHPTVLNDWKNNGCFNEVREELGYRLKLLSATFSDRVSQGGEISIDIELMNEGWASIYNPRGLQLILRSKDSPSIQYEFDLDEDPRFWNNTANNIQINETITLPVNMVAGTYEYLLHMPDTSAALRNRPEYAIRLANQNTWEPQSGFNHLLAELVVDEITNLSEVKSGINKDIYPNPTSGIIRFQEISTYKLYNVTGNLLMEGFNDECDISEFSDGIYFMKIRDKRYRILKR